MGLDGNGIVVLRCGECGLPWARLQNGALVVQSQHSGQKHINAIALDDLIRLNEQRGPAVRSITR